MTVRAGAPAPIGRDTDGSVSRPAVPGGAGPEVPVRAEGVQLLGHMPGSGYREPPALVRRADGQTIQLTPLLYLVLAAVDGRRTYGEAATEAGRSFGRLVTADNVRQLVDAKLRPLGLCTLADGSQPQVRKSNPLLALRFRYVVADPAVTRRLTAPFGHLFNPLVVAVAMALFLAVCAWVLGRKGLASATHQAFDRPGLLLLVFGLTVVSAGFHEFGHAAAARYGGATPGAMGMGLYLVWPAFYTDVTDSYRLGRAGRVRTDLGGLYFNALVALGTFAGWWVTGWDSLLLVIVTQVLQMVRQLAPLVRFDGYHVLADLTGVPDLYQHIKPTLLGLVPFRRRSGPPSPLKPWARAVITAWVVLVVPLMLLTLVVTVLAFPRIVGTALAALGRQWTMLTDQLGDGDLLAVLVRLLSIVAIVLPLLGIGYILTRLVRQIASGTRRVTAGRPLRRALAGVVAALAVAGLAWAWWPGGGTYRPVQPYERGALLDVVPVASSQPVGLVEGRGGNARVLWPTGSRLPSADRPELALVLVPRHDAATPDAAARTAVRSRADAAGENGPAPTWVFPFNRPAPPGEGDNQALAVNTEDGSVLYDVAFALVWADEGDVLNRNEAYALASCTKCGTVAVAFQVVLILGQADVVVPQNISAAVNYGCLECVTYALAKQLVVTVPGALSPDSKAALDALWKEIAAFGATLEEMPLADIQKRLTAYEARLLDVLRQDPSVAPAGSPSSAKPTEPPASAPAVPVGRPTPGPTEGVDAPSEPDGEVPTTAVPSPTSPVTPSTNDAASPAPTAAGDGGASSGTSPTPPSDEASTEPSSSPSPRSSS
jgi:putative peptide zinc metalloprotease protein